MRNLKPAIKICSTAMLAAAMTFPALIGGAVANPTEGGSEKLVPPPSTVPSGVHRSLVETVLETDPSLPLPVCDNRRVLKKITRDFNWAERNTWHRGFKIDTLGHPQQKGIDTREDQFSDVPLVPVRYCEVTAHMTNGQRYSLHYIIEAKSGFAGVGWGAEFCVHGLDPWNTFGGHCRAAHPAR
ncbi:MAG: hypothetical protein AAGH82_02585 [Pseudomonadota bacterium]